MQNFTHGMALPTILSEARKYALSLTIATQTLAQLPEESVAAVFGNCATICSFRVSAADAKELVREFGVSGEGPRTAEQMNDAIVPATELQNLPDYRMYVRTMNEHGPEDPTLTLSFPATEVHSRSSVAADAWSRYGRSRNDIANAVWRFLGRASDKRAA